MKAETLKTLFKFYQVDTLEDLVEAQSKHIEKLQLRRVESPVDFRPSRPRG